MTERFVRNYNSSSVKVCNPEETQQILREIYEEISVKSKDLIYKHEVHNMNLC